MRCLLRCSAHIVVATPGRLVDMFSRKHTEFDLSASVKALVCYSLFFILPKQPYTYNIHTLDKKHNNTGCNVRELVYLNVSIRE